MPDNTYVLSGIASTYTPHNGLMEHCVQKEREDMHSKLNHGWHKVRSGNHKKIQLRKKKMIDFDHCRWLFSLAGAWVSLTVLFLLLLLLFIIIKSFRAEVEELRVEMQEKLDRMAASQATEQPEEAAAVPEYFGTVMTTSMLTYSHYKCCCRGRPRQTFTFHLCLLFFCNGLCISLCVM